MGRCLWKWSLLYVCWVLTISTHMCSGQKRCFEEERKALLEIKAFVIESTPQYLGDHEDIVLKTWTSSSNIQHNETNCRNNCCDWERVTCDLTTGHVTQLSLDSILQGAGIYVEEDVSWNLNISLFLRFKQLQCLVLSGNYFYDWVENNESERFSSLKKLEILDLSSNNFDNEVIFTSVGAITSLKTLILDSNSFGGYFRARDLAGLRNLEMLDVSYNNFEGSLPLEEIAVLEKLKVLNLSTNSFNESLTTGDWTSFHNLEILDLRYNYFAGSIPSSFAALSSLKALSFVANNLEDSSSLQGLCELKKLEELDLHDNHFEGALPLCLGNLTSLRMLDLSNNQFNGSISPSLIASLASLEYIDLSQNNFEGIFSLSWLSNHSKLESIKISNHNHKFKVETDVSDWIPNFQLKALVLSNCNMDRLPVYFLLHQYSLRVLVLSHNIMEGSLPNWLLENNTELIEFSLRNNSLSGHLRLPLGIKLLNLSWMDLSDNNFSGLVERNLGQIVPHILYLNLSRNNFEGDITSLFTSNMSELGALDLSNNKLSGQIFSTTLKVIRVSNFTSLATVIMSNNLFEGPFPVEILRGSGVEFLDISQNSFSGSLPSFAGLESLSHLHLQGNRFTGSIPQSFSNLTNLLTLNMGDNNFYGFIPNFVGALSILRVISLSGNNFNGFIPDSMCELTIVSLMDLSRNSLSGSIPQCFKNISFGFDVNNWAHNIFQYPPYTSYYYLRTLLAYPVTSYAAQYQIEDKFEFVTKYRRGWYKGSDNLDIMSGLDLSCNNLTGNIPQELGILSEIHSLNLSHNQLTGPIPVSFSNLTQMESLDISFNRLSGRIPWQLIDLNFLSVFNVAHNNLSDRVPERKGQFSTFEANSYVGNPFLCGPPLERSCTSSSPPSQVGFSGESIEEEDGKWYEFDHVSFAASFVASYTVFLFGYGALLYINPNWGRRWFYFVGKCLSCFY